ncbi:MAG: 3-oxoacyl-ACP reductase [Bacteroidetes bacterium]|nr:MAG: 3-oxoacyl-ACP reductase [Bacteroidota bacterium]
MTQMESHKKKVAMVTGGGSGIGFAIAQKFVENQIQTIIVGRDENKLKNAKSKLGDFCEVYPCDLSRLEKIPELVESILKEFGRIDILVNNAGTNMKKNFIEVTDQDFQQVILTNLVSVFALSREVVKNMIKNGSGNIINISSMASQYGLPKVIAYTASKSAIEGMTRAMATELSPQGIRINCIAPGFIITDMTGKAFDQDPDRKNRAISRTPLGEMGKPEDIAEAAYFLISPGAKYVTGTVLPVDGGNSIGF